LLRATSRWPAELQKAQAKATHAVEDAKDKVQASAAHAIEEVKERADSVSSSVVGSGKQVVWGDAKKEN
jgi:vacuolar-type H+-ATPase subunit H